MFCPKCGSEMPDGARFCGECGFRMEENVQNQDFSSRDMIRKDMPGQDVPKMEMPGQRGAASMEDAESKKWKTQWTILLAVGVIAVGVAGGFLIKSLVTPDSEQEHVQEFEMDTQPEVDGEDETDLDAEDSETVDSETVDADAADSQEAALPEVTAEPEEVVAAEEPEEVEEDLPVSASLILDAPEIDNTSLFKVNVDGAEASSTISQQDTNNSPILLFDERDDTSWQEGVKGYGIGECIDFKFDDTYEVQYFSFKLGNWKNDKYYFGNAKPKTVTLILGDFTGQVTFTGDRTTEWVKLSKPVSADAMTLVIDDVYPGTSWEDTCITEMGIYGY